MGAPSDMLYGRRIIFNEHMSTLGTLGDLVLWSPRSFILVTSGGVESARSPHIRFDYLEEAFRFNTSADGCPLLNAAITPAQGSNTLGTQVGIATRS
jgi:hypothetical protein